MYKKNIAFSSVIAVFLTSVPALAAVSENYQITSKAYVESQLADKQDKLTDKNVTVQGAGDVVTGIDIQNGQVVVKKDATLPTMDANVEIIDLNEYGKDAPTPSNIVTNFEVEDGKIKVTKGGRVTSDDLDEELADNINAITGILDEGWWQAKLTSHQDEADIISDLNGEPNLKINGTGNVITDIDASWGVVTVTNGNVAVQDNEVTSAKIADGTITNADISTSAAIDQSKISGLTDALAGKQDKLTTQNVTVQGAGDVVTGIDVQNGQVVVKKDATLPTMDANVEITDLNEYGKDAPEPSNIVTNFEVEDGKIKVTKGGRVAYDDLDDGVKSLLDNGVAAYDELNMGWFQRTLTSDEEEAMDNGLDNPNLVFEGTGNVVTNVDASRGVVTVTKGNVAVQDNEVTTEKIADGTITNADISTSAAIDQSKISGLTNALAGKLDESNHKANSFMISNRDGSIVSGAIDVEGDGSVLTDIGLQDGRIVLYKGVPEIEEGSITSSRIKDGTISYDDLDEGIISSLESGDAAYERLNMGLFQYTLTSDVEEANDYGNENPNLVFKGTGNVVTNVEASRGVVTVTKGNVDVPTVNNATLTIKNGATNTDLATFTANSATAATATIPAATPTVAGLAKYGQIPLGSATSTNYATIWVE